jgi:hypothetical protein
VGFTAGTFVLTDTALKSFDDLFGSVYQGTDVVVQGHAAFTPGEGGGSGGGGGIYSGGPSFGIHSTGTYYKLSDSGGGFYSGSGIH